MNTAVLIELALELSKADQRYLYDRLMDSIQEDHRKLQDAFKKELQRRIDDYRSGRTKGIPWSVVRERLRKRREERRAKREQSEGANAEGAGG